MDEQPKDQIVQMVCLRETDRAAHQLRDSGPKMRVFRFLLSRGRSQHIHTFACIVKLSGIILLPGNSRPFPGAISTDPTLRQPVSYP